MYRKKKISNVSEPTQTTQPERSKKFVRKNSYCSLNCRSASQKRSAEKTLNLEEHQLNTEIHIDLPVKGHTESLRFPKNPEESPLASKNNTMSMKLARCKAPIPTIESCELFKTSEQVETDSDQVKALKVQLRKTKVYLNEERDRRKLVEEQLLLSKQQIKRLERRLQKHMNQKQRLKEERQFMLKHIEEIQNIAYPQQAKIINSYRLKFMEEEVNNLRAQLQKKKTQRQKQLTSQMEILLEQKYKLEKELNAAILAKDALSKQLQEANIQMEEIRSCIHQKVVRSAQYIELRERYRILLTETKWLKEQIEHLEQTKGIDTFNNQEMTLLTVSADSIRVE